MNQLTTRELLYLEDICKLFESTIKNCNFAASNAIDPEFKSLMHSMATEHRQWIDATVPIVNGNRIQ